MALLILHFTGEVLYKIGKRRFRLFFYIYVVLLDSWRTAWSVDCKLIPSTLPFPLVYLSSPDAPLHRGADGALSRPRPSPRPQPSARLLPDEVVGLTEWLMQGLMGVGWEISIVFPPLPPPCLLGRRHPLPPGGVARRLPPPAALNAMSGAGLRLHRACIQSETPLHREHGDSEQHGLAERAWRGVTWHGSPPNQGIGPPQPLLSPRSTARSLTRELFTPVSSASATAGAEERSWACGTAWVLPRQQ